MSIKNIIVSVTIIISLFGFSAKVIADPLEIVSEPTISELIDLYTTQYNISSEIMNKVIKCESDYKINAINYNDGGQGKHSFGILQFQQSTFNYWEDVLGEDLDYYSYRDQIKLGSFMFSKGQAKQWSCYRKL